MKKILNCRRSIISILAIFLLFILGLFKGVDVAASIAAIAIGLAGSNAYEKKGKKNEVDAD